MFSMKGNKKKDGSRVEASLFPACLNHGPAAIVPAAAI
jgi:hypothetical protein